MDAFRDVTAELHALVQASERFVALPCGDSWRIMDTKDRYLWRTRHTQKAAEKWAAILNEAQERQNAREA